MGVQRSREAARAISCKNNLAQLGLSIQNFESSNGSLPDSVWHIEIMRFAGLENEYEQMVQKSFSGSIQLYLCPSDNTVRPSSFSFSSYQGNSGVWPVSSTSGYNGVLGIGSWNPGKVKKKLIKYSDITDGLTSTALVSEALTGSLVSSLQPRLRWVWELPGHPYSSSEFEELVAACQAIPSNPIESGWRGVGAAKGTFYSIESQALLVGITENLYNHAAPPQSPTCTNAGAIPTAIASATSNHVAGPNLLFCDGHVESIEKDIDINVWRACGDRDGSNPY